MVQRLPEAYVFDPNDPRAPSEEQWQRMPSDERARVVSMLPAEVPLDLIPNEGDPHRKAKRAALDTLAGFFQRANRRIYLSSDLTVYYPREPAFAPDLIAVRDVEPYERLKWVVEAEGAGLGFVLDLRMTGDRRKDEKLNVERYARLGIEEYFIFDRARLRLTGYRLPAASAGQASRAYQRIVPQIGRFASHVLGLDLALDGARLRFFAGTAVLEDADEMIARLGAMLDKVISGQEEAEKIAEELSIKLAEEHRLREEAEHQLAEARAEIERLKKGS